MTEKKCSKCGEVKPLGMYGKRKGSPDGLRHRCKSCRNVDARKWAKNNPSKVKEWNKQRREKDGAYEKKLAQNKKWREKNKDKCIEIAKKCHRRKTLQRAKASDKHTYLVTDGEFVKIGVFTEGKLDIRVTGLQNGNPRRLEVLATSASNIEKLCHYEFEHLNVLNEWFKLDLELITFFTEHAE